MNELQFSDSARQKILNLLVGGETGFSVFRVEVKGGGCSGYKYDYSIDQDFDKEEDVFYKIEKSGVVKEDQSSISPQNKYAVIDHSSLEMLSGSVLDYIVELGREEFVVNNPKAATKCGCGVSFSL